MSKHLRAKKRDANRRWHRATGTGFIRPHFPSRRRRDKLQKILAALMPQPKGDTPDLASIQSVDTLEVKEIL